MGQRTESDNFAGDITNRIGTPLPTSPYNRPTKTEINDVGNFFRNVQQNLFW